MNGLHKLECYITIGIVGFPWTNTLAYWTQLLFIMSLWLLILFVSLIVPLDSEYSIEETSFGRMLGKCVLACSQNAFLNRTCKWGLSGNLCSWQDRQSNLPRALRKLTKKMKTKIENISQFLFNFCRKTFFFFLPRLQLENVENNMVYKLFFKHA
jgi:hypothetical protein